MKNCMIVSFPGNTPLAMTIAKQLEMEMGLVEIRDFPDQETYVRIDSDVKNKTVLLVCGLEHPNNKILTLMFIAQTIKELGASKICLITPYLPYMRQDKRFKQGEAITSTLFAKYLSSWIDCLITIDPHLHRIKHLSEIYSIPSISVLHATQKIAAWIRNNVALPLIIGPDKESQQWVTEVADLVNAPFVIINKTRYDDRKVSISMPTIEDTSKTPILMDDIISTGTSMLAVIKELIARGFKKPICIGVHGLCNQDAYDNLMLAGAQTVITCNTIPHFTNKIDITDIIVEEIKHCIISHRTDLPT